MDKIQNRIVQQYIKYVLEHKAQPASVVAFVEDLKIKESTFLKYFNSFDHLDRSIWKSIFEDVRDSIQSEDVYESYSVNEKLLAFYYSWIETLKDYRSYAIYIAGKERFYELYPGQFEDFKQEFEDFAKSLVEEGLATEEIARRRFINDSYKYIAWVQPVSIFKFWIKDESENFQDTDALIEKTVNFSFDLMRSNSIDSFFDLAKFHIQHF